MNYMPGLGRAMNGLLNSSAENETLDLPGGEFVARTGKLFKMLSSIAAVAGTGFGCLIHLLWSEEVGILFLILGIGMALLLPTLLSWRCIVNKTLLKEEYFVLFIKRKKEILWDDVKYRKIVEGNNKSIVLYNADKKRLISFDGTTVGFSRIVKLAKRSSICDLKKAQ